MKYYHPSLFPEEHSDTVKQAFADGYAVVFQNTYHVDDDYAQSSMPSILLELTWMVKSPRIGPMPSSINEGWFPNAYGFEKANSFIVYAYFLWKHSTGVFGEEFAFINERVRIKYEESDVDSVPLSEWFQNCEDNGEDVVFKTAYAVLGPPQRCLFQSETHREDITKRLKNSTMVALPGISIRPKEKLHSVFSDTLNHILKHYTPKPHEDYPYEYFKDLSMTTHGPLSSSVEIDNVEFELIDPVITAHRFPADDPSIKDIEDDLYDDVLLYYGCNPSFVRMILYKNMDGYEKPLMAFRRVYETSNINLPVSSGFYCFPHAYSFVAGLDTKKSKRLVFIDHNSVEFYELFETLLDSGVIMKVTNVSKLWRGRKYSTIVGDIDEARTLLSEISKGKSQIEVECFLFNDLSVINRLKLHHIFVRTLSLNLARVRQGLEALERKCTN